MKRIVSVQVLGTDMAKHFEDVGKLTSKVSALTANAADANDVFVSPKSRKKVGSCCRIVLLPPLLQGNDPPCRLDRDHPLT